LIQLAICIAVSDEGLWKAVHSTLQEIPVRVAFEQAGIDDLPSFLEKLERMRPDAVLLDLAGLPGELNDVAEAIASTAAKPYVVVIHPEGRPDLILAALRAGAKEFLFPPLETVLPSALIRLAAEREKGAPPGSPSRKGGRLVGFLSAKGGCGATTLACHSAMVLEQETSKPTLLCDFDLSSGMVRFLMKARSRYSVMDAFANVQRLDHSYWHALVSNGSGHLEIISGPETAPLKEVPNSQQVQQVLRFARTEYDWLILDLGRGLSPTSFSAIEELDDLFLVTTPEVPALHQCKQIIQQLLARGLGRNRLHLVLNRHSKRLELTPEELENLLGVSIYATVLDQEAALRDAYSESRLLSMDSPMMRDINAMVGKLADFPPKTKKRFSLFG
jgi:pilus assembly protein CpaE